VSEELSMLAIHGVLHLLGFDHHSPEEKSAMWAKQGEILHTLGIEMDTFSGDE
jgi:probable rRNA maturation factor